MLNLADKLWQASMAITAFAVLQGLAFLIVAHDDSLQVALFRGKWYVLVFIVVYHFGFCVAIYWCHSELRKLALDQSEKIVTHISQRVMFGQLVMVGSFGLFCFRTVLVIEL